MSEFSEKVYAVVSKIPKGKTMTYKEVAAAAGRPKAYRAVGNILNKNKDTKRVPCHRVIQSDGKAGGYAFGEKKKLKLLKQEGAV
jgi:O-6-methylguanine DNA methyltransferase